MTDGRPPAKLKGVYGKEEIKDLMAEEIDRRSRRPCRGLPPDQEPVNWGGHIMVVEGGEFLPVDLPESDLTVKQIHKKK